MSDNEIDAIVPDVIMPYSDDDIYEILTRKIFRQDIVQEGLKLYRNEIKEFLKSLPHFTKCFSLVRFEICGLLRPVLYIRPTRSLAELGYLRVWTERHPESRLAKYGLVAAVTSYCTDMQDDHEFVLGWLDAVLAEIELGDDLAGLDENNLVQPVE